MGQAASKLSDDTKKELDKLMQVLRTQRDAMLSEVLKARGDAEEVNYREVAGGRTAMRVSSMNVATSDSVDGNILMAIENFFKAAQGAIDGQDQAAKHSAVAGAKSLVEGGLKALMGVSSGQSNERRSFVVLFMNNAFVRVDYYAYSYAIDVEKNGKEVKRTGSCYVADLAVLDTEKLNASEIDFLLSQALHAGPDDLEYIEMIKMKLIESSVLSRMLGARDVSFSELSKVAKGLSDVQADIQRSYKQMMDYKHKYEGDSTTVAVSG